MWEIIAYKTYWRWLKILKAWCWRRFSMSIIYHLWRHCVLKYPGTRFAEADDEINQQVVNSQYSIAIIIIYA